MATIIDMPKLSDTMTVGTLVKWLKKEGDAVSTGVMIAEIETDKATMELECFEGGVLLKQIAKVGDQIAVGAPICVIGKPGEDISKLNIPAAAAPAAAVPAPASASAPAAAPAPEPVAPSCVPPAPAPAPAAAPAPVAKPAPVAAAPAVHTAADGRQKVSPLARKVAADKGVDVSRLAGSGPGGRVVKADVLAAAEGKGSFVTAPAGKSAPATAGAPIGSAGVFRGPVAEQKDIPLSNMRATIARRLVEAKSTVPHFYLEVEVDAAPLLELRAQVNGALEKQGVKLSVNDFILKASVEALRRVPGVNASWEGTFIRQHAAVHISFAVAIEDGLITPVVRDAHNKSVFEIGAEAKTLGSLAKQKKLKPDQYTGGTFCVSNLGMMGVERFHAIINPPNAAILAVGATVKKPVVGPNDTIVVGQRMTLALSCDHRVADGVLGAQWLAAVKDLLEKPALLLL